MATLKNLKNKRFGYLKVISDPISINQMTYYRTNCVCGKIKLMLGWLIKHKNKSCGCINRKKHGHASIKTSTYLSWDAMVQRCTNKKHKAYKNYGGKGISICERWMDFNNFLKDMGEKPEKMTLERIDRSKGYNKRNCIWADRFVQNNNTSRNVFYDFDGKIMTISEASRFFKIKRNRIHHYMFVRKLSFKDAKPFIFSKKNLRLKSNQLNP